MWLFFFLETHTISLGLVRNSTCELQDLWCWKPSNIIALYSCLSQLLWTLWTFTACLLLTVWVFFSFALQVAVVLLTLWSFYSFQEVVCRASPFPAASPAMTWQVFSPTQNISSTSSRCTRVVRRPHLCPLRPEVSDSARGHNARDLKLIKKSLVVS